MIEIDSVLAKAKNYDVITFDVFDTLLIRDVIDPADIFTLAYGTVGRYIRILAEIKARQKSKNGEVTLDDINSVCPFSCEKELDFETKYCRANPKMFEIYSKLKESGKKIYAISDMYLSSDFIGSLLNKAGIDIPVLVSCEEHVSKKDGQLFNVFLKKFSYSSNSVLHIGDSIISDYEGAKKAGIESFIVERHHNILSYTKYSRKNPEMASFINHGLNELFDPVERIGYEIVGPMIMAFCQWIHDLYINKKIKKLFFLARDMRFSYEIYRSLYPEDNVDYLLVSRKSLLFAKDEPSAFCEYLKNAGCYGNVYIVDTGWIGNAQVEIEKYSKMIDKSSDVGGLYLGSKLAFRMLKRSNNSYICLYSTCIEQIKCQLFPAFMETLIGCNEEQVIRYEDGKPIFDREYNRDNTNLLKNGAKKFILDWVNLKLNQIILKSEVKRPFEKLFYNPQAEHINLIGKLHYEDERDTQIVSFDEKCSYWNNPGKMLSDLSDSGWKGAFLKKMGIIYPILLFLYVTLGTVRLYLIDKKKTKNTN